MKKQLILFTIFSLSFVTIYKSEGSDLKDVMPYLKTSSDDSFSKQKDMNDLSGCQILIEQGEWNLTKYGSERHNNINYLWTRSQTWRKQNNWESNRSVELDRTEKSYELLEAKEWSLVYAGKWEYVKKIDKNIRLIAQQHNDKSKKSGALHVEFESQDSQNQKIPAMPLQLIKPTYGDELCILKWHNKYGYNAIAETYRQLRQGFWAWLFRDYELVVTGKIVEIEE